MKCGEGLTVGDIKVTVTPKATVQRTASTKAADVWKVRLVGLYPHSALYTQAAN